MSKRADDLSQDPFDPENLPERQSIPEDMRDVAMDKAKSAVKEYPRRLGLRLLWSIILMPSLANDLEKDRMLDRLEEGQKVGCYRMIFGGRFRLFSLIRTLIFFGIIAFAIYYLWANGFLDQIMEQQALIESLQATQTP